MLGNFNMCSSHTHHGCDFPGFIWILCSQTFCSFIYFQPVLGVWDDFFVHLFLIFYNFLDFFWKFNPIPDTCSKLMPYAVSSQPSHWTSNDSYVYKYYDTMIRRFFSWVGHLTLARSLDLMPVHLCGNICIYMWGDQAEWVGSPKMRFGDMV